MARPRTDECRGDDPWPGVVGRAAEDDPLIKAAEHDVDRGEEWPQDLGRVGVGPEPAAQVDVERDREAVRLRALDGFKHRGATGRGQRWRDAGEVKQPGAVEDPGGRSGLHVLRTEA